MNDDHSRHDDDDRTRRRSATPDRLRPPLGDPATVPPDDAQSGFARHVDYRRFPATAPDDMYVVPFGLENSVSVGMPGYVPVDPASSPLFQSLPSISAIQSGKFYPHSAGKHHTGNDHQFKDDRLFQLMSSSSSSSLPVPPQVGDGYSEHYETQQNVGGYVEMTPMSGMEHVVGEAFLPRCFGSQEMLPGYAPMQAPSVSAYHDADGILQSYATARPSLDQFVHFDVDSVPSAALPPASYTKPASSVTAYNHVGKTDVGETRSIHLYSQHLQHQHQQVHLLAQSHQPTAGVQPSYRLPYPAQPPPSLALRKSPPSSHEVGSGSQQPETETDEINTRAVAARVAAELKRYSVPQAVFAQLVLCRSQGTLSDLLRNPKPWSKLKSGRETFRRMWKWLQEPEYQRMSALRFAGRLAGRTLKLS